MLLKLWLSGSALLAAALAIYAFAPILIPLFAVAAVLAGLTLAVTRLARWLANRLGRPGDER